MDGALRRAKAGVSFDIRSSKWIVFSDLHRGARNLADDFVRCEETYLSALWKYLEDGFTLVGLGDMEDLWKESPASVFTAHSSSFHLERSFSQQGRYLRFWGNHDEAWGNSDLAARLLRPMYGDALRLYESLRVPITNGTRTLGELFFVHGHQGTLNGERFNGVCRPLVRHFWRLVQLYTGLNSNGQGGMPLMNTMERKIGAWARRNGLTVVSGHTHRPMINRGYMNSGACCYSDGTITGLEFDRGQVRHVEWSQSGSGVLSRVIKSVSLDGLLTGARGA